MSRLEIVAVVVSVLGVWLTTKRSLWNFPFSLASVALYAAIFYRVKLYADVILQGAFAVILLYGLVQWLRGKDQKGEVIVARVTNLDLVVAILAGSIVGLTLGYILASSTDAALPWIDSSLLSASLIGSFWGARRIVEQWWVWIAVDGLYALLYIYKLLYFTAALYAAFVGLAIYGLIQWRTTLLHQLDNNQGSL